MHNIRTRMRSRPLPVLAAAALLFIISAAVEAHGVLQSSAPAAGTVLPSAPDRLDLQFNESVDPQLSTVILVREDRRTPLLLRAADGPRLSYALPRLETGLYVIDWRVISAADGHLTRGALTFGVGEVTLPVGAVGAIGPTGLEVAVRWVGLIGVFVLVGGAVMMLILPAPEAAVPGLRRRLHHLAVGATAAVAVAGLLQACVDAAAIAGAISPLGAFGSSLYRVVAASHSGHDLIFRITGAVFLMQLLRPALPLEREGVGAVLGVMLIGPTLTMHGLAVGLGGVLVGMTHLIAASVWMGGLAFFGAVYLPILRAVAPEAVQPAALRLSRVALGAVAVLVLTGLVQSWLYVGSPAALTGSPYGRALLAKLVVIAALLVVAGVNRWGVLPRLTAATTAWRPLLTLIRLETALGLIVALLAATIAISQPAKIAGQVTDPGAAQGPSTLVLGGTVGDITIRLTVTPPRTGRSRIEVTATGIDGRPVAGDTRYRARLISISRDLPARAVSLQHAGGPSSGAEGLFFDASGWWGVEVGVRRKGREDAVLLVPVLINPPNRTATDAGAMALLQRAERLVGRVRTWQETEHLASGTGNVATTRYAFARPDRLAYATSRGAEGRVIGRDSYYRDRGGPWRLTRRDQALSLAFRFPLGSAVTGATLGAREEDVDGTFQIVTYQDPSGELHFAAWIDLRTGLPRRIMMVGESHYMVAEMKNYDRPVTITPP